MQFYVDAMIHPFCDEYDMVKNCLEIFHFDCESLQNRIWVTLVVKNYLDQRYRCTSCRLALMASKRYSRYWPSVSGIHPGDQWWNHRWPVVDYTDKGPVKRGFDVSFDVSRNKLLYKWLSYRWFQTPWDDKTMCTPLAKSNGWTFRHKNKHDSLIKIAWFFVDT